MAKIQGSGVDVSVRNPREVSYIKGDADTEGSVRLIPSDEPTLRDITLQIRKKGVFRGAGLNLSAESLSLGFDLSLSGHGASLKTESVQSDTKELLIGVEFNDDGSSVPKIPILGIRSNRVVLQSVFTDERIDKKDVIIFVLPGELDKQDFRYIFYFKSGSLAATAPVTQTVRRGSDPDNGEIIFRQIIPTVDWSSNTEIQLNLEGALSMKHGDTFSSTLSSDEDFSILGDFTFGLGRFFAVDIQPFRYEMGISSPTGTDRFLADLNGSFIVDKFGNLILQGSQVVTGTFIN